MTQLTYTICFLTQQKL